MIESRRRLKKARALQLAALLLSFVSRRASAGDAAAAAEVLFSEGKRLEQAGDYGAACPKFEESQKIDPGTGTLYRLADCYEHVGRTASAWAAFLEVASAAKAAGQQARADDAKKRAGALEAGLPRLVIRLAEPDVPGLVVTRGDIVVGRAQWNTPIPVDPGPATVEARAQGRTPWRGVAAAQAGATTEVQIPALAVEQHAIVSSTSSSVTGAERAASVKTRRTVAVVTGAVGIAALGVGAYFGLASLDKKGNADKHCDADNACDDEGLALRRDARTAGTWSTIGFAAGAVLAATGVIVWLTAPSQTATPSSAFVSNPPRIGIAPRWGGLTLHAELP